MTSALPTRADVLEMLAGYGERLAEDVNEELGSLELTWLIAQAEQRYSVLLDLTDEMFAEMGTVAGAVDVLRSAIAEQLAIKEGASSEGAGHG